MKRGFVIGGIGIILLIGGVWLTRSLENSDRDIIAKSGLHWHPTLTIYVDGQIQEIPENIGLGAVHQPMHTHDDLPVIHLEFSGIVRKEDAMLGQFFRNWGYDIRSFGTNMRMTVNGVESTDYEKYIMHDGDEIELRYD